jgi:hypothetical protein
MRVTTKIVWDMDTMEVLEHEHFEYPDDAPVALADRSIQQQAGQDASTAGSNAAGYGTQASQINAKLMPTLNTELAGNDGLTATQKNNLLVAGQQGSGGAAGGVAGTAGLAANRTKNSGALSATLDAAARSRGQQESQANLGVENESTKLATQRQQQAQQQMQGLYGTDVSAQLGNMGIQNQDISNELAAGRQGWLQNTEGVLGTVSNMGAKAAGAFAGLQ